MENSHIYIIVIKSDNPKIDEEWKSDWMLETTHLIQLGDTINFNMEKCLDNLLNDYNTASFKVINRVFFMDSDNSSSGGYIELHVSPLR